MMQPHVQFSKALSKQSDATPCVFVVDDDACVRESLERLIDAAGWTVEAYACAEDFLARPRLSAPSCLVADMMLPDANGLDLQRRLATDRASMPIVFTTRLADVPMTIQAIKAGAVDLLVKPLKEEAVLAAISLAIERSASQLVREAELRSLRERYSSLTRRERQVLELVVAGRLNKQTAAELELSEVTVKCHRGKVMRKMNAGSLAALVRIAGNLSVA